MSLESFLLFLFIGLVAGWLAGMVMKGSGYGMLGDIVIGIIGSFLGGLVFGLLGLGASGLIGSIIVSFVGAIVLIFILRTLTRVGV